MYFSDSNNQSSFMLALQINLDLIMLLCINVFFVDFLTKIRYLRFVAKITRRNEIIFEIKKILQMSDFSD